MRLQATRTIFLLFVGTSAGLSIRTNLSRRLFVASVAPAVVLPLLPSPGTAADLTFSTSTSGLQWADAKVGSGSAKRKGDVVAIDFVMSTTGARYGTKIYSNKDSGSPYRWVLGDGTTIRGLEEAIIGNSEGGVPPMLPGGIRRAIVPSKLAYQSLALSNRDCQAGVGPIPPSQEALGEYQRFKNIYCNPNLPYQPDLVMDIKMYGKRTSTE